MIGQQKEWSVTYIYFYASLTTEFDNPELECAKFTQNFWKFILTDLVFYGAEIDANLSSGCGASFKGKKISKWPLHFFQLWFIFNKVTNYVKKITPELVSLKIGAFFAFFSSKWDICRTWLTNFSLCAKNCKIATGPCKGSASRCGLFHLPLILPTNLLLMPRAFLERILARLCNSF